MRMRMMLLTCMKKLTIAMIAKTITDDLRSFSNSAAILFMALESLGKKIDLFSGSKFSLCD